MTFTRGVKAATLRAACAIAALLALSAAFAAIPAAAQDSVAVPPQGDSVSVDSVGVGAKPCPVAGYCERVVSEVRRFFHPPAGAADAAGVVCFRIQRDGGVTDIQAQRVRGGSAMFRLAMMEAVEAAGSRRAFGPLPAVFDPRRWRWCVELSSR
ncbi:MAG TPA: hypothetical protein VLK84_05690 [Longimicrobium sp.]|nr:hypothetical protein [Longimicrobium sp.]